MHPRFDGAPPAHPTAHHVNLTTHQVLPCCPTLTHPPPPLTQLATKQRTGPTAGCMTPHTTPPLAPYRHHARLPYKHLAGLQQLAEHQPAALEAAGGEVEGGGVQENASALAVEEAQGLGVVVHLGRKQGGG